MDKSKELQNDNTVTEKVPSEGDEVKKSSEGDNADESHSKELSNISEVDNVDESPSSSKDLSKNLPEEAFNNFVQGKRHMLVHDYQNAVQSLAVACEHYVKNFGELATECGEVYFLYGKSLVRLSQQQSGVLGDALNKAATTATNDEEEESSEEEEKENESEAGEVEEKEQNGSAGEGEDNESEEKEPSESTDSPQAVEGNEVKEAEKQNNAEDGDTTLQNDTVNEEADQEPEEDDLELAWNSLEAAKTIFSRKGDDKEAQLKIAEIFQLLAEISMESDNYPQAINDLKSCLCIQRIYLDPDDRLIAHTYYEMGLGHMLQKMYDEALDNFTQTLEIFQLRRNNLVNSPISETVGGFEAADRQRDLEELDSVITDIKEKIDDTKDLVINAQKELQEALLKRQSELQVNTEKIEKPESNAKPVSNITHLLKRKKPDEEEKESESKRIKMSNGDGAAPK